MCCSTAVCDGADGQYCSAVAKWNANLFWALYNAACCSLNSQLGIQLMAFYHFCSLLSAPLGKRQQPQQHFYCYSGARWSPPGEWQTVARRPLIGTSASAG